MDNLREILRLHESGSSNRQIKKIVNISRSIIAQYIIDLKRAGLTYESLKNMSDSAIKESLDGVKEQSTEKYKQLAQYFEYFTKELKRVGVTKQLLWQVYLEKHPDGYKYTQFCHHFQVWHTNSDISLHIEHKAGDKMFCDFAGERLYITDRLTNKKTEVETFIAVLCGSGYTYIEATENQKKENFIKANENALWYFKGVPNALMPDCLKSGVNKPDRYEPEINETYADFAEYYKTVILPARVYSAKDKALVENAVRIAYMWIYAPLRNQTFYSLAELNEAIAIQLEKYNTKLIQRLKISRRQLYEEVEKKCLKGLPLMKYEFKNYARPKVQFNYHIHLSDDKHYYSAPFIHRGKYAKIIYTTEVVEIYVDNLRVAIHKRDRTPHKYTTVPEHMPPNHQFYNSWSEEKFLDWAEKIGVYVCNMIKGVLEKCGHPEQGYRVCLGILSLSKKYGNERLNNACRRSIEFKCYSYKKVLNILEGGHDKIQELSLFENNAVIPNHENIRGSDYYEKISGL